jgi:hypothetical protein
MTQRRNRHRLVALVACLGAVLSTAAEAQEYQPYPTPKVTIEQWQQYLATVRAALDRTMEIYSDDHTVVFTNRETMTFYIFTSKNHPAHPAWITRQLVEENGQVNVRQIGYFAGPEKPFDQFFQEYLQRNKKLSEDVGRRNQ